jgi:hypothetical protein
MIKFFRHLRYKLLSENRTGRYVKYAIGEILLVMIGILLALQVNNWNNERIQVYKEQLILKNLQSDFQTNIAELKSTYKSSSEAYMACVELLEIIKDDNSINPEIVEGLIDDIINKIRSLDLISGSIDEIFNTGALQIIKDPELRKQISNWSFYINDTNDDIEIYENYLFGILIPSLTDKAILRNTMTPSHFIDDLDLKTISKSKFKVDYTKSLRSLEFENQIYNNALNYMYALNSYKIVENYLMGTLELIDRNINE